MQTTSGHISLIDPSPQNLKDKDIHTFTITNTEDPTTVKPSIQVDDTWIINCLSALPSSREEIHQKIKRASYFGFRVPLTQLLGCSMRFSLVELSIHLLIKIQ